MARINLRGNFASRLGAGAPFQRLDLGAPTTLGSGFSFGAPTQQGIPLGAPIQQGLPLGAPIQQGAPMAGFPSVQGAPPFIQALLQSMAQQGGMGFHPALRGLFPQFAQAQSGQYAPYAQSQAGQQSPYSPFGMESLGGPPGHFASRAMQMANLGAPVNALGADLGMPVQPGRGISGMAEAFGLHPSPLGAPTAFTAQSQFGAPTSLGAPLGAPTSLGAPLGAPTQLGGALRTKPMFSGPLPPV
jgi:hypothetical protein